MFITQGLTTTTQGLDHFMACRRSNGTTIQGNVLNIIQPEVFTLAWQLNDIMNKYYNNKLLEKVII